MPEETELSANSIVWQIRRTHGDPEHSVWKFKDNYFLRKESDSDENASYSGFDLPNGFFINLVGLYRQGTYISRNNTLKKETLLSNLFSDPFGSSGIFAQLAYNYDGDIHLLNDYYFINTFGAENISLQKGLQRLANMWAGWLSSTYVLSDSVIAASTQVTNTIYKKKQTNFIKDIIFKSNLADENDNLLLNGYKYSKYLADLQKQINGDLEELNVTVKFNNIIKNIPIIIQLDSLPPEYKHSSSLIRIKQFCNQSYDNINITNVSDNNLYQISNNTLIPVNNNQKVHFVKKYDPENSSIETYGECTFTIPKVFKYQDKILTPIYSGPTALRAYSQCFYGGGDGSGGSLKDLLLAETIISDINHV